MAEQRLGFRVDARDDASAVFSKIASTAKREMSAVEQAMEDGASAGRQMAAALDAVTDRLEAELKGTERAAKSLADALGPEFVATVGQGRIEEVITDFRRVGLTFEEIEADADALAASIKRGADVAEQAGQTTRRAMDSAADGLDRTSTSGDQSRSVLANLAGNATSELPGISNALGPVNVALGQLAEYAVDGNIKLSNLAGMAGPMLLVGGAIAAVGASMQRAAARAAELKELQEGYVEAIREGGDAIRDQHIENFINSGTIRLAHELGVDLRTLASTLENNADGIQALSREANQFQANNMPVTVAEMAEKLEAADLAGSSFGNQLMALAEAGAITNNQMQGLLSDLDDLGSTFKGAGDDAAYATEVEEAFGVAAEQSARAVQRNNDRLERSIALHNERNEAITSAAGADLALRDALDQADDALADYNTAVAESGAASEEAEDAGRQLEGSYYAAGEAAGAAAENQARAAGRSRTAVAEGAQAQIETLYTLALNLDAGSPVRAAIEGHIQALLRIPENRITTVSTNFETNYHTPGTNVVRRAAGGTVFAGQVADVGEHGQERVVFGETGRVVPNDRGWGGGGGSAGSGGIQIVVNAGMGADGYEVGRHVVHALREFVTANGPDALAELLGLAPA